MSSFQITPTSYSIGGLATSIHVHSPLLLPNVLVLFDSGATPYTIEVCTRGKPFPQKLLNLVSHGHLDHVHGMFAMARVQELAGGGGKIRFFVPRGALRLFEEARDAMSRLERGDFSSALETATATATATTTTATTATTTTATATTTTATNTQKKSKPRLQDVVEFVPVSPGDEILLTKADLGGNGLCTDGSQLYLRIFETDHCTCADNSGDNSASSQAMSVAYVLVRKLKPAVRSEFSDVVGPELGKLVQARGGGNVFQAESERQVKFEVCYTGDSHADGLVEVSDVGDTSGSGSGYRDYEKVFGGEGARKTRQRNAVAEQFRKEAFLCGLYICELTYMEVGEKWRDYARVWSHVCIEGVEGIFRSNGWLSGDDLDVDERKIVFFHVSHRYTTRQYLIKENIRSVLPKDLVERAGYIDNSTKNKVVWLKSKSKQVYGGMGFNNGGGGGGVNNSGAANAGFENDNGGGSNKDDRRHREKSKRKTQKKRTEHLFQNQKQEQKQKLCRFYLAGKNCKNINCKFLHEPQKINSI